MRSKGQRFSFFPFLYFLVKHVRGDTKRPLLTLWLRAEGERLTAWKKTQGFWKIRCWHKLHSGKISSSWEKNSFSPRSWHKTGLPLGQTFDLGSSTCRFIIGLLGAEISLVIRSRIVTLVWWIMLCIQMKPRYAPCLWMLPIVSQHFTWFSRRCGFHACTVSWVGYNHRTCRNKLWKPHDIRRIGVVHWLLLRRQG